MADTQRLGRRRQDLQRRTLKRARRRRAAVVAGLSVTCVVIVIAAIVAMRVERRSPTVPTAPHKTHADPVTTTGSYIGLYPEGAPNSYGGVTAFTSATGIKPRIILYYSGWLERFQTNFATTAADNGAVPLVQLDPKDVSIAAIASGAYDGYLTDYAKAVRAYHRQVILGFGHEMNGYWYSWGYQHTSPATFVAAWRHIVTLFRASGAQNVIWLWTINTIHPRANVPSARPWWPGSSYVNWVGIDGYYFDSSSTFAPLFGPTIAAVRALTRDPILISETAAAASTNQPAKITDLFTGIRLYDLLGFVWFNAVHATDWRLTGSAAFAAFRRFANYSKRAS